MTGPSAGSVSLILTVKDEAATIDDLLASIATQTRRPDEVVVVDGGSRDGTVARLRAWEGRLPLRVIEAPGATISEGRNRALAVATGEIVAVTDAGVRLDPAWLARVTEPFTRGGWQPDVVGGFFRADPRSLFEVALAVTTLPDEREIDGRRFLPSSRSVAFRRSWYLAGIQYPEWLDYCEDLIFDLRLRRAGARFEFRPAAFVWFRPRTSLRAFWHQYFRYARGDGKAGLFARRHAARYLTYGLLVPLALSGRWPRLTIAAFVGAVGYMRQPWRRLWCRRRDLRGRDLALAAALAPVLRLVGDVAKMAGYPVGLIWRVRRFGLRATWRDIPEARESGPAGKR